MAEQLKDFLASTTLNGGITDSALSLVVASAANFPASGTFDVRIDSELITVTAVSGTTFTITRAVGTPATTAVAHLSGATIKQVLTKRALEAKITESAGAPALSTLKGCRVTHSVSQTLNSGGVTTVVWDTDVVDTDGFHDTSSNTGRFTVPTGLGGLYDVGIQVYGNSAAANDNEIILRLNGTTTILFKKIRNFGSGQNVDLSAALKVVLSQADYVEWRVYVPSSNLGIENNGPHPIAWFYQIGA